MTNDEIVKYVLKNLNYKLKSQGNVAYRIGNYSIMNPSDKGDIIYVDLLLDLFSGMDAKIFDVHYDDEGDGKANLTLSVDLEGTVERGISDFNSVLEIDKKNKTVKLEKFALILNEFDYIEVEELYSYHIVEDHLDEEGVIDNFSTDDYSVLEAIKGVNIDTPNANLKIEGFEVPLEL